MTSSFRLQELFSRYCQRSCTPAEVAELVTLLEQADAREVLTEPMRELWEEMKGHQATEYAVDWDKMYARVSQVEEDLSTLSRQRSRESRRVHFSPSGISRRLYWMAAAMLLLLVIPAYYWIIPGKRGSADNVVAAAKDKAMGATGTEATGSGQASDKRKVVHLPDGSTVLLNSNSTLEVGSSFTAANREVTLTGEAYFDISHRTGHPFLVHTGKLTTRVLGTAFNIKAYPSDASIEVTVTHGKVQVLEANRSMGLLTDDQQIRYDKGTAECVRKRVDSKPVVAWRPAEIHFDDWTMEQAARQLEERFKVRVVFVNPLLKDCRVTATFYEADELEEIMTVLCAVSQARYHVENRVITIDGKGCN